MNELISFIESEISQQVKSYKALSGGDISSVYMLESEASQIILKTNRRSGSLAMFRAEYSGLKILESARCLRVPKSRKFGEYKGYSFLLMEFIDSFKGVPDKKMETRFGRSLAQLHQVTNSMFGLDHDNFIGSLKQINGYTDNWIDFFVEKRLLIQMDMAIHNHLLSKEECPGENQIKHKVRSLFVDIKPSLLHGDLWNGNYLFDTRGDAVIIDPAVYYGHSEVDIAMSLLFGGFSSHFYGSYQEIIPKTPGFEDRIRLYQLYYLLVHLNLFGSGYYGSVSSILKRYFN